MSKCCIFDLDGTLVNTIRDLGNAANYALEKNNCEIFDINCYYDFVGNGIKNLCKTTLIKQDKFNDDLLEKIYADFINYYNLHYCDFSLPYKGINELLDYLCSHNYLIGIYSNKEEKLVKKIVNKLFKSNIFTFILGESINFKRKPDVTQLNDSLNKYDILTKDCIYIGDSEVDIKTAKNANIKFIGVSYGFRNRKIFEDSKCDFIVDKPIDIIELLKRQEV